MARTMNLAGIEAEIIYSGPRLVDVHGRQMMVGGAVYGDDQRLVIYETPAALAHDFVDALIGFPSGRPHACPDDPEKACREVRTTPLLHSPFSWRDLLPRNWCKPPRPPDRWRIHAFYETPCLAFGAIPISDSRSF